MKICRSCGHSFEVGREHLRSLALVHYDERTPYGEKVDDGVACHCPVCFTVVKPVHAGEYQTWKAISDEKIDR